MLSDVMQGGRSVQIDAPRRSRQADLPLIGRTAARGFCIRTRVALETRITVQYGDRAERMRVMRLLSDVEVEFFEHESPPRGQESVTPSEYAFRYTISTPNRAIIMQYLT